MEKGPLQRLQEIAAEIADLHSAAALLAWDEQVYMPKAGAPARAQQAATLRRLAHEKLTDPQVGELLEQLAAEHRGDPATDAVAAMLRVMNRKYHQATRVPAALVAAEAKAASAAYHAWLQAREEKNFGPFREPLAEVVKIQVEKAEALGYEDARYDALLDLYEPEMRTAEVAAVFARLKDFLVPMLGRLSEVLDRVDDGILYQEFDEDRQWALTLEACRAIGFDFDRGRQDRSVHPFTTACDMDDVRITTRINRGFLGSGLFASLHEAGHGLYEQGIDPAFRRSPLGSPISLGIHESQSRLYENLVGRSRAFWQFFMPKAAAAFPARLEGVTAEDMYRAVNKVAPSLIRVEADEVTYPLHIMVRFELEQALIQGDLTVDDLPGAFDDAMEAYLGLRPANSVEGVLQDIHWSGGYFGYFPTYTLGTLMSVQIFEAARRDLPHLAADMASGRFIPLREWLREHIHRHGSRFMPQELLQRATGSRLDPQPFINYVEEKYSELYGL
ncbi:MAG TPA: carboxypeptidase M32 [Sphingobacteriaceae bacterium]|nr:carboxypeptidase M32 [Sphingobacteriaceae bacterium]